MTTLISVDTNGTTLGITGGGYIYCFGLGREVVKLFDEYLFPGGKANL